MAKSPGSVLGDLLKDSARPFRKVLDDILGFDTDVALFPVRHHSPSGARHLEKFLREFKPDRVLIEGPQAFNDRIDMLADPAHQTPFALVSTATRKDELPSRAYYPMCDYSPELVAIRVGKELGAEVRFNDLVHGQYQDEDPDGENAGVPAFAADRLGSAEDGRLARSKFTQEIVKKAGCRDFDEVWEVLFEQAGWSQSPLDWSRAVAAYAYLARAGYSPEELAMDGTLARERTMARHLADAKKEGKRVVVVTGAFHTVALRDTTPEELKKRPNTDLEIEVFLAPYTFPRLDALLGYASGMSGPQFYQWVWEARKTADPFRVAARRVLVETTRLARKDGELLGTADAIAALTFAQQLADFRGRAHVGRMDLLDAARSTFVKGDVLVVGARVEHAIAEIMRGTRVGRLGASAGQHAVVVDFHHRLKELRLPVEHGRPTPQELYLFESDLALARSRFFHQCQFLEIPFVRKDKGPNLLTGEDMDLKVEHWSLQYVPEVESKLEDHGSDDDKKKGKTKAEKAKEAKEEPKGTGGTLATQAHLGTTVEDVASALLIAKMLGSRGNSGELASHLVQGLVMGLHKTATQVVPQLSAAMFSDDDVLSLLQAGNTLRTVMLGRERLEASGISGLPELARQAYVQGTLRLPRLASFGPERVDAVLAAVSGLTDVALTDQALSPSRAFLVKYASEARELARGKSPAILGALDGFLVQLAAIEASSISRTFGTLIHKADGVGSYLEGVVSCARHVLTAPDAPLLDTLLDYIRESEWEMFLASLPSLRRALTRLSPRETEAVATRCAASLGISLKDATDMLGASPEQVAKLREVEKAHEAQIATFAGAPGQ